MMKKMVGALLVLVVACGFVLWTPRQADAYYVRGYFYNPRSATYYPSVSTNYSFNPYTGGAYYQQNYYLSRTPYTGSYSQGYLYSPTPYYPNPLYYPTPSYYPYPSVYYGY
jgi:hypothetical protein